MSTHINVRLLDGMTIERHDAGAFKVHDDGYLYVYPDDQHLRLTDALAVYPHEAWLGVVKVTSD